jgi:hypothetical protein
MAAALGSGVRGDSVLADVCWVTRRIFQASAADTKNMQDSSANTLA